MLTPPWKHLNRENADDKTESWLVPGFPYVHNTYVIPRWMTSSKTALKANFLEAGFENLKPVKEFFEKIAFLWTHAFETREQQIVLYYTKTPDSKETQYCYARRAYGYIACETRAVKNECNLS